MKFDISKLILKSSNIDKIREYKRILGDKLKIEKGRDLKEVNSDPDNVSIYKAIDAGKNILVEDTILKVNSENIIDIRYKINDIKNSSKKNIDLEWETRISILYEDNIYIFKGSVKGFLTNSRGKGFGFDPYFQPYGSLYTLAELDELGKKDDFSARVEALTNLLNGNIHIVKNINEVEPWNGSYQKDILM